MKAAIVSLMGFLLAASTYGQGGQVNFANTATTLITTQSCFPPILNGVTTAAGQYTIGLYTVPFGTTNDDGFVLVATTPSLTGLSNGRFNGGNIILGFPTGTPISFQIRAWSAAAGSSYEQALQNGPISSGTYMGKSARGFVVLGGGGGGQLVPGLMGNDYGQVPGFSLYSLCACPCGPPPLPADFALSAIRSGGAHTISWPNTATSHLLESAISVPGSNQWTAVLGGVFNTGTRLTRTSTNDINARFYRLRRL
jgi:hypothetical protein